MLVQVLKDVGTFKEGQTHNYVRMQKMTGKIYKPGKDDNGQWLDKVGEPDTRSMIWSDTGYACVTPEKLNECFKILEP